MAEPRDTIEARFLDGVDDVAPEAWDRLVGDGSPFAEWEYLHACEIDSATPENGVMPKHLTLWHDGELVAACPLYVKADGRGEFIYDWQWYVTADRLGIDYYPKLVSMPPFTPATGAHFLVAPDGLPPAASREALVQTMASLVDEWAEQVGLKGVHYLFATDEEASRLERLGYLRRLTFQLGIENRGWQSVDDYLGAFRAKHRIKLRREMRRMDDQGLSIRVVEGDDIRPEHLDDMHAFYLNTCLEHGTGSDYLKRGTWEHLFDAWRHRVLLCFAEHEGRRIGGSLCVQKDGTLYGRYWGCRGEWHSLYFNLAFFAPLRVLIERGGTRLLAGFGNAHYKHVRGFEPVATHSVHKIFDERFHAILSGHLAKDRTRVAEQMEEIAAHSRLRDE